MNKEHGFDNDKLENKLKNRTYISRGDDFDIAFSTYFFSEVGKEISKKVNTKFYRLDSNSFSYRIINHWEKIGLLSVDRPEGKGWRKYSLMDLVWTRIISELRKFGYPLEKTMKIKQNLQEKNDFEFSIFPLLEMYTMRAFNINLPVSVLIFENGDAELADYVEYRLTTELFGLSNHIKISINEILQRIFPDKDLKSKYETAIELNSEELDLLYHIRMGDFESIQIKTANGEIEFLEATKTENVEERFINLLKKDDYQDITFKKRNGNVVAIKRSIKIKYKNGGKNLHEK